MDDEIKTLRADVMSTLRACIMSSKGGVLLDSLNKDYRSLEGENIPYRKMGCSSLEEFISQVPRVRKYRKGQDVFVEVVPDESTAHLAELISKQRSSKKKPSRMSMTSRRPMMSGRPGSRFYDSRAQSHAPRSFGGVRGNPGVNSNGYRGNSVGYGVKTGPRTMNSPPRKEPNVFGGRPELPVTVYPAKVTVYPPKPLVKDPEPKVTVYPGKIEPKVTVYPGKTEPTVTVYSGKTEATVTTYPGNSGGKNGSYGAVYPGGASPGKDQVAGVQGKGHEEVQRVQNGQNGQNGVCNGGSGVNGVNGNFGRPRTPPGVPELQGYGQQRVPSPPMVKLSANGASDSTATLPQYQPTPLMNGFRLNGYSSPVCHPPTLPQTPTTPSSQPPHLKVVRPLSERLRRPSPVPYLHPHHPELISNNINPPQKPFNTFTYSTPPTPPPEVPPQESYDPREELKLLSKTLNLPEPEYKDVRTFEKHGKVTIFTQVILGPKHKYTSYPFETDNKVESAKLAAGAALNALHLLHRPPIKLRTTTDRGLIQQRVLEIVDGHPSGVFKDQLPVYYEEKHQEALPEDWVEVVQECREISLQKGVENSLILCRCVGDVQRMRTPPLSPLLPKPLFKPPSDTVPVPLLLPPTPLWPVYVSQLFSTSEVWIRLLEDEYNEKFFSMSQDLTLHYSTLTDPAPSVKILNYYVIKINSEAHRVRVEALDPLTGDAEIFFIDSGDSDVVDPSKLLPMAKKFLSVPPQAIRACLSTLEDIPDCFTVTKVADKHLLDKTFYIQVLTREEDELSPVITGVFYDTTSEADVNVNDLISSEILELSRPELHIVKGRLPEVFVSHIDDSGDVYLQVKNDGSKIIKGMISAVVEAAGDDVLGKAVVEGPVVAGEVYLAQKPDNEWVRVTFECGDGGLARMVDSGGRIEADFGRLLRAKDLGESLVEFPRQCVKVKLHNVGRKFDERMKNRLRELAGFGDVLLCKVVVGGRVELFKRSGGDNLLISINNTLDLEEEIGSFLEESGRKKRLERRGSRGSDEAVKGLKQPRISGVGEYFEVHVENLVASPGNFVVQPFEERGKLEAMMHSLQDAYKKTPEHPKLEMSDLEKGRVYAVKNYDGYWYRACLNRVIDEQSVAMHLCDYGNIEVVGLNQVQQLRKEFFELPYQAIKARLFGIKPLNKEEWSLQTCVRFQKLVMDKDFVSVVRGSERDDSTPSNTIFILELIDVSDDEDIYIHQVLIDEGRVAPA